MAKYAREGSAPLENSGGPPASLIVFRSCTWSFCFVFRRAFGLDGSWEEFFRFFFFAEGSGSGFGSEAESSAGFRQRFRATSGCSGFLPEQRCYDSINGMDC